jgi:hypothetical protein
MNRLTLTAFAALAASLTFIGCSEAPKSAATAERSKEAAKPPEPISAKTAFWKMYKPIYAWSKDAMPLSLTNKEVADLSGEAGKEPVWIGVWVSPSKREARTVIYSEIDSGSDVHKGVTVGAGAIWSGATRDSKPFQNGEFSVDSEAAYKIAYAKAESWLKTHPGKKPSMLLASAARYSAPVWLVTWGDQKSGFSTVINATSGDLISPK